MLPQAPTGRMQSVRACVREMGARAVLRVKASCPKAGSQQKTPVHGGGGAATEATGRRAGSDQRPFRKKPLEASHASMTDNYK